MRRIGLFAILAVVGCANIPKPPEKPKELEIVGENVTPRERAKIETALALMPEMVRNVTKIFHIRDDIEHFKFLDRNGNVRYASAHAEPWKRNGYRRVCIRRDHVDWLTVWHESGHIYDAHLRDLYYEDMGGNFDQEWKKIAGNVYSKDFYADPASEGVLTAYGRTNYEEDIAEWVESCYAWLYTEFKYFLDHNKHLRSDARYRKKLDLLYEYGFFSEEDYKKLRPLFY